MSTPLARFTDHCGIITAAILLSASALLTGCGGDSRSLAAGEPFPITVQTDWFAQPEHGGFYQALAKGYYEEAGLEVTIVSGGPNAMTLQRVLRGRADFAMNRADFVFKQASEGIPIRMVMATLQKDPQAIMMHADNPIERIEDLDGKAVMAIPGLTWITYVERKFGIRLNILPHDFGMERFLNNPDFIQQCLETNEPFYARQHGVEVKTLPLRDTGFNPYHGLYALDSFIETHPEAVRRFVEASIRGWEDFATGDPSPAFELIAARNPRMNQEFMEFSHRTLVEGDYITGDGPTSKTGQLDPKRLQELQQELIDLEMVKPSEKKIEWYWIP
ncbi:MAG: ABC transporter substrate-binding protein [Opitutales bacterium]|nr:ABC transporter substrate-binding protein [Opitutales bacterium]